MINTVSVLVSSRIGSRDPKNRVALAKDPVAFVARKKLSLWLNTVKSVNPNSKFKKVQNWKTILRNLKQAQKTTDKVSGSSVTRTLNFWKFRNKSP